jgi:putative membrane protein
MRSVSSALRIGGIVAVLVTMLACGGGEPPANTPANTPATPSPSETAASPGPAAAEKSKGGEAATEPKPAEAPPPSGGPTDPQIAAIVVTANTVDIDAGKLALKMSKDKEVQKFATWMIDGHGSLNTQAGALATKLKLTPEPNPTSESLKKGGDENLANLKKLTGATFDKAYVEHEVAYHKAVLDAVNKVLIPNAKNAELKALLESAGPTIEGHLQHAEKMLTAMNSKKAK